MHLVLDLFRLFRTHALILTLDAALMALLVLGLNRCTRRRWSMGAALGLVFTLRLALAWVPLPAFRVPVPVAPVLMTEGVKLVPLAPADGSSVSRTSVSRTSVSRSSVSRSSVSQNAEGTPLPDRASAPPRRFALTWSPDTAFRAYALWLLGVLILGSRVVWMNLRLGWLVRKGRVLTDQPTLELLERCKADMGVTAPLVVVVTDRVHGPALFGLLRPRLILSQGLLEHLSPEELRHIFLHELAHLRRVDLLWAWIGTVLQVLHWFNPLVWLAFRQMRADREVACDAAVLGALPPGEAKAYGHTLLRLVASMPSPSRLPSLAGIREDASLISRRIHMITRFESMNRPVSRFATTGLLAATVLLAFGVHLVAQEARPANLATPIRDNVKLPFERDPELLGSWRTVDFVPTPETYVPGSRAWKGEFFLQNLMFRADGTTNTALTWTRGQVLHLENQTASRYLIRQADGRTLLFMEWKSGDYTLRGMKPHWYVLEKDPRLVDVTSRTRDRIDQPFVDDPAVLGTWRSVDFVNRPASFQPAKKAWQGGELFLKGLTFEPGGKMGAGQRWTRGLVLHAGNETASRYQIQDIDGKTYLFFEWKSGDYTLRGQAPEWYVLTR